MDFSKLTGDLIEATVTHMLGTDTTTIRQLRDLKAGLDRELEAA